MINEYDALKLFLESVHFNAYADLVKDIDKTYLPEGFYDFADDPGKLSDWYLSLDDDYKNMLKDMLKFTTILTVFRFLTILDNCGAYPVQGTISDFALYLQTYDLVDDRSKNNPKETVRINQLKLGDLSTEFTSRIMDELGITNSY